MQNGSRPPLERNEHAPVIDPALRDELTSLPNRVLWSDRAGAALREAARTGRGLAVLCVDVDDLGAIHERWGQDVVDEVLREVAARLQRVVRPYDTVARVGDEGFLILCPLLSHGEDGQPLARRLQGAMATPVQVDGLQVEATLSIGIAFADGDEVDPDLVVGRADTALRAARERGGARFETYQAGRHAADERSAKVLADLERAHANGEFVVFYQPIVEARSHRVVAVEALLRWENPEVGTLTPRFFMDVMEANELMHTVGADTLRSACSAGVDLIDRGQRLAVHVNVSATEVSRPGLTERVRVALEASGLPAELLVIEIAESTLLSIAGPRLRELAALRASGVRIAVDHVGTRSSRSTHLAGLPIDLVKLDMEIVADILATASARAVSSGVRAMATGLGAEAMAAGVESDAQAAMLEDLGFGQMQGHAFGLPVPLASLLANLPMADESTLQERRVVGS
ncbi:MAG: bifunctional diguanylate cyclase/phosphodiesterase [Propionibacteriales bacterium]|nr:bifunctional diguanylate cyclase/phosphodiesterase [Propionibacteriales bacterium]